MDSCHPARVRCLQLVANKFLLLTYRAFIVSAKLVLLENLYMCLCTKQMQKQSNLSPYSLYLPRSKIQSSQLFAFNSPNLKMIYNLI